LFEKGSGLSVELIRDILDEVHLENDYPTQYSTVYDLKNGMIYLYHFHNYGNVVIFDLKEELAKGYHSLTLADLFPPNPEFQDWAQPELKRLAEAGEKYSAVELDPAVIEPYLGDYAGPDDYNMLFEYYSIAYERGRLVLKMLPDKAWMELTPTSETTFFHISSSSEFEVSFLPEENGEVNRFVFSYLDQDIPFHRLEETAQEGGSELPAEEDNEPTFWETQLYKLWRFSGTNTFKFLALVLGLILLQTFLGFMLSRIV
jgi:hypothetical protein